MLRLAILASGNGSNVQAILDAFRKNLLGPVKPVLIVADRDCGALARGKKAGLETLVLLRRQYRETLSDTLDEALKSRDIDLVALAGWLSILDGNLLNNWKGRMLNIHPSLLPRHGGPGMYGTRVHESVLAAGDDQSGCTVHQVTQGVDAGPVLGQSVVPVLSQDTVETLAARILLEEHKLFPQIIAEVGDALSSGTAGE